jgi:hypothetical protein
MMPELIDVPDALRYAVRHAGALQCPDELCCAVYDLSTDMRNEDCIQTELDGQHEAIYGSPVVLKLSYEAADGYLGSLQRILGDALERQLWQACWVNPNHDGGKLSLSRCTRVYRNMYQRTRNLHILIGRALDSRVGCL